MQHTAHLMLELIPALGEVRILRSWSGTIGPTPDGVPVLEACASPRGFILATGFGGNGFVTAPAVGKVVADLVAHGAPRWTSRASARAFSRSVASLISQVRPS